MAAAKVVLEAWVSGLQVSHKGCGSVDAVSRRPRHAQQVQPQCRLWTWVVPCCGMRYHESGEACGLHDLLSYEVPVTVLSLIHDRCVTPLICCAVHVSCCT